MKIFGCWLVIVLVCCSQVFGLTIINNTGSSVSAIKSSYHNAGVTISIAPGTSTIDLRDGLLTFSSNQGFIVDGSYTDPYFPGKLYVDQNHSPNTITIKLK
jgi:hypothetical protein